MGRRLGKKQHEVNYWLATQKDREEWFTVDQIMVGTGLVRDTVKRSLKALIEKGRVSESKDERGKIFIFASNLYKPPTEETAEFREIKGNYWRTTYARMNPFMGNVSNCSRCGEYATHNRSWDTGPATSTIEFKCKNDHTWRIGKVYD